MGKVLTALGINYKTAPVEVRELFSCPLQGERLEELSFLSNLKGVEEIVLLSTCNRVEIYALLEGEEIIHPLLEEFIKLKLGEKAPEEFKKYFFVKKGKEAVEHIISIPAGLDSMVIGENQIAAQFKEAFEIARRHKTLGPVLERLYQRALRAAKRIRSSTNISKTPVSVSYIAVVLAKNIFGFLENTKVLVVGAGEIASLTAQYLKREKAQIYVTNRTFEKALSLASRIGASIVQWERFKEFLKEADIVIVSTGAKEYLITAKELEKLFKKKKSPTVFIDLSVPRNVEPKVGFLEGVFLYNIDDLKEIADKNLKSRKEEAQKGWPIVEEEAKKFLQWFENLKVNEGIKELNLLLEQLKEEALKEGDGKEESLQIFTKRLLYPLYRSFKRNPALLEDFLSELRKTLKEKKKV